MNNLNYLIFDNMQGKMLQSLLVQIAQLETILILSHNHEQ